MTAIDRARNGIADALAEHEAHQDEHTAAYWEGYFRQALQTALADLAEAA